MLIAGGGTAGHVNPALALAEALEGHDISFLGTERGAEARLVPAREMRLHTIEVRGFDRARPLSLLGTGFVAARAVVAAGRVLDDVRPNVVVGMGGYVSLPAVLAAKRRGIPIVVHEQNIVFGLANRLCRRFATRVCVSFQESLEEAGASGVVTGNPVFRRLRSLDRGAARGTALERYRLDPHRRTLLVFGGSQGARTINEAGFELRARWADRDDLQVLHILGSVEAARVEDVDEGSSSLLYRVVASVEEMGEAYAVADLALCRGGATTVAELTVVGVPAMIVPYPYHRDRQQERHARVLTAAGAAVMLLDREATAERIAADAQRLLRDRDELDRMRSASLALAKPDAADRLAEVVLEVAA